MDLSIVHDGPITYKLSNNGLYKFALKFELRVDGMPCHVQLYRMQCKLENTNKGYTRYFWDLSNVIIVNIMLELISISLF